MEGGRSTAFSPEKKASQSATDTFVAMVDRDKVLLKKKQLGLEISTPRTRLFHKLTATAVAEYCSRKRDLSVMQNP